jgi:3-methyladenine DNA glycosylase AlkD
VRERLRALADPERAANLSRYFKTGPGEYGAGDRFHGIRVPDTRRIARAARDLPLDEVSVLLASPMHEERQVALLILVRRFERARAGPARRELYEFYVRHLDGVNNWDLVDVSAPTIVGGWLMDRGKAPLDRWARSPNPWRRRIAILATAAFIRHGRLADTLRLAKRYLGDPEDLIHKAAGWMLREVGQRDRRVLEAFLSRHHARMPRTMLRYAIEKLPESRRKAYLRGIPGKPPSRARQSGRDPSGRRID